MSDNARMMAAVAAKVAGQVCSGIADPDQYIKVRQAVLDDLIVATKAAESAFPEPAPFVPPAPVPQAAPVAYPPQQGVPPQQAVANVAQGFPGAQVVAQPQGEWTNEQLWLDVINNPGNWYDNRGDDRSASRGGNGPDFRCKDKGPKPKAGLWLYSPKYGNFAPDWVFQRLNIPKPVPQQTAAVQQGAVAGPVTPAPGQPVPNQPQPPAPYQPDAQGNYGPDEAPF